MPNELTKQKIADDTRRIDKLEAHIEKGFLAGLQTQFTKGDFETLRAAIDALPCPFCGKHWPCKKRCPRKAHELKHALDDISDHTYDDEGPTRYQQWREFVDSAPQDAPSKIFDPDFLERNNAFVAAMPDWAKGSPVNKREPAPQAACIHAQLQMQLVVPEECLVRGDIGAWYKCQRCGEQFRTDLKEYKLVVTTGAPQAAVDLEPLKALCDAATPGPWKLDENYECYVWGPNGDMIADDGLDEEGTLTRMRGVGANLPLKINGQFIAAARTAIPALIHEVESLHDQLAEYSGWSPHQFLALLKEYRKLQQSYVSLDSEAVSLRARIAFLEKQNSEDLTRELKYINDTYGT